MKRRGFLAAIAGLPFVGRWLKVPAPAPVPTIVINVGGSHQACAYETGMAMDLGGQMMFDSTPPAFIVTAVDYERGTITLAPWRS